MGCVMEYAKKSSVIVQEPGGNDLPEKSIA